MLNTKFTSFKLSRTSNQLVSSITRSNFVVQLKFNHMFKQDNNWLKTVVDQLKLSHLYTRAIYINIGHAEECFPKKDWPLVVLHVQLCPCFDEERHNGTPVPLAGEHEGRHLVPLSSIHLCPCRHQQLHTTDQPVPACRSTRDLYITSVEAR